MSRSCLRVLHSKVDLGIPLSFLLEGVLSFTVETDLFIHTTLPATESLLCVWMLIRDFGAEYRTGYHAPILDNEALKLFLS